MYQPYQCQLPSSPVMYLNARHLMESAFSSLLIIIKCTELRLLSKIGLITSPVDSNAQQNECHKIIKHQQAPNQSHAALSAITSYAILLKIQGSTSGFNMRHLPGFDQNYLPKNSIYAQIVLLILFLSAFGFISEFLLKTIYIFHLYFC